MNKPVADPFKSKWVRYHGSMDAPPVIQKEEQKLLTIYLDNIAYAKGKSLVGSFADKHGLIEEHLAPFLNDRWRVANFQAFGGGSESLAVRGWIVVLLERP